MTRFSSRLQRNTRGSVRSTVDDALRMRRAWWFLQRPVPAALCPYFSRSFGWFVQFALSVALALVYGTVFKVQVSVLMVYLVLVWLLNTSVRLLVPHLICLKTRLMYNKSQSYFLCIRGMGIPAANLFAIVYFGVASLELASPWLC